MNCKNELLDSLNRLIERAEHIKADVHNNREVDSISVARLRTLADNCKTDATNYNAELKGF